MKKEPAKGSEKESLLEPVEALADRLRMPWWKLVGAKAAYGWADGKELTEEEFLQKVDAWCCGPLKGVK